MVILLASFLLDTDFRPELAWMERKWGDMEGVALGFSISME
jgi:hypothetical protein